MVFFMRSPQRSRHPLVRILSLLLGAAVLGVLLVFGLAVAGVLLVVGVVLLAVRQWKLAGTAAKPAAHSPHQPDVLEGEFEVIRQQGRPVGR